MIFGISTRDRDRNVRPVAPRGGMGAGGSRVEPNQAVQNRVEANQAVANRVAFQSVANRVEGNQAVQNRVDIGA